MPVVTNRGIMCKVFLFIVIAGIYCDHAFGQDAREQVDTVVAAGNRNASFPGGPDSMMSYFSLNLRYPSKAMEQKLEGEVMVGFEIDELGMIHNALVLSGLDGDCDKEAIRVVGAMPRWVPALQHGKPVKTIFRLPIYFQLPDKPEEQER